MDTDSSNTLLVRQPIFTPKMQVYGYQLCYRDRVKANASAQDIDKAAAKVIVDAFTCAAEFSVCEDLPTFIKVSTRLLLSGNLLSLPPQHVVLDITDDVELDDEGLKVIKHYRSHKFRFAIEINQNNSNSHQLMRWADYIRLDINVLGVEWFGKLLKEVNTKTPHTTLIASSVETQQLLRHCQKLNPDLIQGEFLCRPAIIKGRDLSVSQMASIQMVSELQSPNIVPKRIAELLRQSPELSYRLLRLINSATYELTRTIESLQEAVIYLGLDVICHWVSLMVLADASGKPKALVMSTLVRAKMCESLSNKTNRGNASSAFLIGLFSTLDAMLDISMSQALDRMPLSDEVNVALIEHEGPLGVIVHSVIAYEQGHFEEAKLNIDIADYQLFIAYGEAVLWAKAVCSQLFAQ